MKKGFTMIELIFVIVILGVLASVAIPKLYGTKQDAEIAKVMANLRTIQSDITSYYLANGNFADDLSKMTNVPVQSSIFIPHSNLKKHIKVDGVSCLTVTAMPANQSRAFSNRVVDTTPTEANGSPGVTRVKGIGGASGGVASFVATIAGNGGQTNPICKAVQLDPEVQRYLRSQYQHNGKWFFGIPITNSIN